MPLIVDSYTCGALENNVFIVHDSTSLECALIDPTMDSEFLASKIESAGLLLRYIVDTHGHFDHTFHNRFFKNRFPQAELLIHKADEHMLKAQTELATMFGFTASESPVPNRYISESDELTLGIELLKVLETPGHSEGGICLYHDGFLIAGDTLFKNGIGRTDLPGGNHKKLLKSIKEKIYTLPECTIVYCGHGPNTTVGYEKTTNPFIRG